MDNKTEGRIIKSVAGFYYVQYNDKVFQCRGRGNFRKKKITPVVGDWVVFESSNPTDGYIMDVKERKNELNRPPISNVDQAILVFSAVRPEFSSSLLDRFLVHIEDNGIQPVICITKMDLIESAEYQKEIENYIAAYKKLGYEVIPTSAMSLAGMDDIKPIFKGKTSVFAGQSGVGKSSLLNALMPELMLETNDISDHLGRGKHTTRHVELLPFEEGLIADTPGFSSLDFVEIETEELSYNFPEMKQRVSQCKFRGCTHSSEPKCAVKKAVEEGEIPSFRYEHYLEFLQEIKDQKRRY
ncbi:ribosome small subunit-dependent GTPase A [Fictibacillus sp. WQ 8-8]|uniref:ribosome small subunit-dependent GTPase A n=1 Tax=unclassified Fictibacillus TaxID=2644029 RepID=UPI0006A79CBD|nr:MULTISPECIES: ribosome small subunit-dependent GTPase A [unclassified Fictibacillus]MCQ6265746.1 ribosome small subunit-dependent GTPase A [Fictibacillus sp. WQ 8-8]MED2973372.1 ribosome small subunit-dependent GTPase A [Fictibacillus sp. B-59209]UZJ77208.1 ribosome small subunit-dependent GTPase A [Fictibacillus sp. KU28468]SFD86650.1 ribosome biogenesis GTPase [Bacillus sp. OV194]